MTKIKKYHAFISYRHADNKIEGRQWATWLHQAIETYEIPKELVGNKTSRGINIPARIYPIFRDEEELPADSNLGNVISRALDDSEVLIVLCSPNAVASTYVSDEIDYFKKGGGSDRIIVAMIDGEPNSSWDKSKLSLGFTEEDECFPIPLQFEYDENGQPTSQRAEPVAADFRVLDKNSFEQGWTSPEAYRQYLENSEGLEKKILSDKVEAYERQHKLMLLKIIASLIGVPLGELSQRDKEYQLQQERLNSRKLRRWLSAVIVLSIMAVGVSILAYQKQQEAVENEKKATSQRDIALTTQSNFLIDLAEKKYKEGYHDTAILLGLNALPGEYGGDRPLLNSTYKLRNLASSKKSRTVLNHDGKVNQAIFSPNENIIATTSGDKIVLWNAVDGKKINTLHVKYPVRHILYHLDESMLFSVSDTTTITLWDTVSASAIKTFQHGSRIDYISLNAEGSLLMSAGGGNVTLWDTKTGGKILGFGAYFDPRSSFSPDGNWLASATRDTNKLTLIDPSGINSPKLMVHESSINHYAFTQDSKHIVTVSGDDSGSTEFTAVIWSIVDGKKLQVLKHAHQVEFVDVSQDMANLLTISRDGKVRIWGFKSGELVNTLQQEFAINEAVFSPDGEWILSTGSDDLAVIWNVKTGERINAFEHTDTIVSAEFSANGRNVLTASEDNTAIIWEAGSVKNETRTHHVDFVRHMSFSYDDKFLVTASDDKSSVVLSVETNKKVMTLTHDEGVQHAVFSKDDKMIVTSSLDETAAIWSTDDGTKLHEFRHTKAVNKAAFNSDATKLFTASDNDSVVLWSIFNGKKLMEYKHSDKITDMVIGPNEKYLVTGTGTWGDKKGSVIVWDINSGAILFTHTHNIMVNKVVVSGDGKMIAAVTGELNQAPGSIQVYSLINGETLYYSPSNYSVNDVVFNADNTLIAYSSYENATIYSIKTEEVITKLKTDHHSFVTQISFSSDSSQLITSSVNLRELPSRATIWSVETGARLQSWEHQKSVNLVGFSQDAKIATSISSDGTVNVVNVLPNDNLLLVKALKSRLPNFHTCIEPKDRSKFFLNKLTGDEQLKRGCASRIR